MWHWDFNLVHLRCSGQPSTIPHPNWLKLSSFSNHPFIFLFCREFIFHVEEGLLYILRSSNFPTHSRSHILVWSVSLLSPFITSSVSTTTSSITSQLTWTLTFFLLSFKSSAILPPTPVAIGVISYSPRCAVCCFHQMFIFRLWLSLTVMACY